MKVILVYPLVFNAWDEFANYSQRFVETFKKYPPGADYELYATCHWGDPTDLIREGFWGIKTRFTGYYADGCDIGGCQKVAELMEDAFVIGFTAHNYFHRHGWLKRFLEAREEAGPGLYGASTSFEIDPHIRTAGYGLDSAIWRIYPSLVETRKDCSLFEVGDRSITRQAISLGLPVRQVTWDGIQTLEDSRKPDGVFRKGDQNAMLWWDRHCELYRNANLEDKKMLERVSMGE